MKPTIYRLTSASTLTSPSTPTVGQQQPFDGYTLSVSRPPSPHYTVFSGSRQITPQESGYSSIVLSQETDGGGGELDEDEPYIIIHPMVQGSSSDAHAYHSSKEQGVRSGGPIGRTPSLRSTGASESSPTPIDPPEVGSDKSRKAQARSLANGHSHGAVKSSTNLQSTLGGGNASRRDVRGMDSRMLLWFNLCLLIA